MVDNYQPGCQKRAEKGRHTQKETYYHIHIKKLLNCSPELQAHWASWMAVCTFPLESNEAICSCQIIAAQHPGPLLPIYISQQHDPSTPVEPSKGIWGQKIWRHTHRWRKKPPRTARSYKHAWSRMCTQYRIVHPTLCVKVYVCLPMDPPILYTLNTVIYQR